MRAEKWPATLPFVRLTMPMASGESGGALSVFRESPRMSQPMIAALVAVAVVALALIAVLRLMRPRQVTLPDYPELPAPPKEDGQGGSRSG
jgi:hypothetical protein